MDPNLLTHKHEPHRIEEQDNEADPRLVQANRLFHTAVMLLHGKRKSVDRAIKCIQRAITFNDTDYKFWQILGEAYYQRGSPNSAINCFNKSLMLAQSLIPPSNKVDNEKRRLADCTYSKLRMSDIRLLVGHLEEASQGYNEIIENDQNNVAALVGSSRTNLQLARNSFSSGLVKLGHSHCMQALKLSLRAIKLCSNLCLTWKLASDCCLIQFVYGPTGEYCTEIHEKFPGSDNGVLMVDRRTCIELAQQFLCKALDIAPFQNSGCLWHNLGISLYLKSTVIQNPLERDILLKRSLKCLLKALDCNRDNSQVKNSIGVVAFNLNLLNSAQNFFIKSIQSNMSTSEMQFSNLGFIYLQKGEFRLASTAFSRSQAEEPLYSRSWLGNALIDEQNNINNLSHLSHCHRLGNNYQSQLMFATKVACLPNTETYRKDLIAALDCMRRMINYNENSLEAINTLGLLYERCNHINQARQCFEIAYSLSSQDSRIIFNKLRQYCASNSCYTIETAISSSNLTANFIKDAESLANGGNREYLLNFIYYSFKNRDYKNVNSKITRLLDKLPHSDLRSKASAQILLSLAAKAEGSDFKSWLFKNVIEFEDQVCLESLINLLYLMLLGSITNDKQLVEQISQDLAKHLQTFISTRNIQFSKLLQSPEGYWIKMTIFCSIFCLEDAGKFIRPLLASFPTVAEIWLYLGLTLMHHKSKLSSAIYCIETAKIIGSTSADLGVICDILLSILSQFIKSKTDHTDSRCKYLSRAIHKYPDYQLLWTSLLSTKAGEPKVKAKKISLSDGENNSLFHLAIDHTIKVL